MNALNEKFVPEADLEQLLKSWGWKKPPESVVAIAEKAARALMIPTGQVLVEWGVIDEETCNKHLNNKPDAHKTVEFLKEREPGKVLPYAEQVLALKHGYPYYENLDVLSVHPAAQMSPLVFKKCETLSAVLMQIEDEAPVLVFAEYNALIRYSTQGKSSMAEDPIVLSNGGESPLLAVGIAGDISALISNLKHAHGEGDAGDDFSSAANLWHVRSETLESDPVARELSRFLDHAVTEDASDLHLVPQDSGALEVYIRKFGILIPAFRQEDEGPLNARKAIIPSSIAGKVVNLIQTQSGANPGHGWLREPGDGNIRYKSASADAFLRVSVIPLFHFNDLKQLRSTAIRIFRRDAAAASAAINLAEMRVPEHILIHLNDSVKQAQGVILVSGPLGQGKSTTIAGMLAEHNREYGATLKRIALEEPVERKIPGVIQFQAPQWEKDPKKRFGMMLKAFKRHDFNVLFMGEVRDSDGADFSVRFASSGHLFLTTLHARDSIMAYTILQEMVEDGLKFQLVECMSLSVSQRLVKKVCSHCGEKDSPITADERRLFKKNLELLGEEYELPETFTRLNPAGCPHCMFGSDGSLPVIELLPFTRKVKNAAHALRRGDDEQARQVMAEARLSTLLGEGLKYVRAGQVDLRSVLFL